MNCFSLRYNTKQTCDSIIRVPSSKSIANRLLILQALYPNLSINNIPKSDDTIVLQKALLSKKSLIDIGHAGTAMRFLTAFFSVQKNISVTITGSDRMKQRPIGVLVEALQSLGATIHYLEKQGFPPLQITGTQITKNSLTIDGSVSSQYITALMLIAPTLPNGLTIQIIGKITSLPYILMTESLLQEIGVTCTVIGNTISISSKKQIEPQALTIESDWSAASYWYSFVALSKKNVRIKKFNKNSIQGDHKVVDFFNLLGIETIFEKNQTILLKHTTKPPPESLILDLNHTPDLAQTIAVTCLGLKINCTLTGLETLNIKETNRLLALKTELKKLGANVSITHNTIQIQQKQKLNKNILINTYQDHRMAMAFTPLSVITPIAIENPQVVSKSYPDFWKNMCLAGIESV